MRISDWSSDVCSSDLNATRNLIRSMTPETVAGFVASVRHLKRIADDRYLGGLDDRLQVPPSLGPRLRVNVRRMSPDGPLPQSRPLAWGTELRRSRPASAHSLLSESGRRSCREDG